ncbi:hypothetical protein BJ170DRAFT_644587 [Xylariales sp. AK1849]|nr:hypothetical protein BJ170DRAFT_644587 [Xylariales sp. AK1849]
MQLITLFVSSLAVSSIHAATIPANENTGLVFTKRATGRCTYDYVCQVSGKRKTCQIGSCSEEGAECDDDGDVVSCT